MSSVWQFILKLDKGSNNLQSDFFHCLCPQDPSSKLSEECCPLGKVLDELKRVEKTLLLLSGHGHDEPGYWTRLAKNLNKIFFVVYILVAMGFLVFIYVEWHRD